MEVTPITKIQWILFNKEKFLCKCHRSRDRPRHDCDDGSLDINLDKEGHGESRMG